MKVPGVSNIQYKTFPVTPCLTAVIAHALLKVVSKAFTMMVKPTDRYRQLPYFGVRRAARRMTQSTVHLLDADHPDLTWLRHEVPCFNTFGRPRFRHTRSTLYHG